MSGLPLALRPDHDEASYTLQPENAQQHFISAQETMNEVIRQCVKFGEGRRSPDVRLDPSGKYEVSVYASLPSEKRAKAWTDRMAKIGELTWADILIEEVVEALNALNTDDMMTELIQVAAVCWSWIADIRTRPS